MIHPSRTPLVFVLALLLAGCAAPDPEDAPAPEEPLFRMLPPEVTQIDFTNTLVARPTPHRNELFYEYFSNGAGVAAGDVNGDGLDDLYFTGNMTYGRLYLNRGGMRFDDVTQAAGVAGRPDTWKTGVTMADVDGDGLLDLYVCYSGDLPLDRRVDELYINQGPGPDGVPRFEERAAEYGLANPHSSNQAYFFDYDRDGDLDLFLLTHNVETTPYMSSEATRAELETDDPVNGVRLYRNQGGRFEDVTRRAGIRSSSLTYGLGAGVSDIDRDGWLDLYIGNDFSPPDYLYMNQGAAGSADGSGQAPSFRDELGQRMGHTSNASMGVDIADIDNDGWSDVVVLDMLPEDNRRQKTLFIPDDRHLFEVFIQAGLHRQYMRNMLQLSNGDGTFSEIGQLAGISNTDWSWAPLLADFDNDGRKDLFVTNGTLHDTIDRDFLAFKGDYTALQRQELTPRDVAFLMERMTSTDLYNYGFRNDGELRFQDVSAEWGLREPLKSTGAAYSDLDGDGDLDLVTNNMNAPAYIFENRAADTSENGFLQVDLAGEGANTYGIGAKVTLSAGGERQYVEQMPTRGYLSSVSPTLHFGLGGEERVDSLEVIWPDGTGQLLTDVEAGRRITLRQADAVEMDPRPPAAAGASVFEEVPSPVAFEHEMPAVDDFLRQPLMVHPKSFVGPVLARADVDGDGLDDVFAGGGGGQASRILLQRPGGRFEPVAQPALEADAASHDQDAAFFDADGNGTVDLYVASGGYGSFTPYDPALQDRLYLNQPGGSGQAGRFTRAADALPEMLTSTGAVAPADVDGDGDVDLFVGGYVVPGRYPESPRSYVLINDGRGRFERRTADVAPDLEYPGMVTDAAWHDLDRDGSAELVVAGLWMPLQIFENDGGHLRAATGRYFDRPYSGLWNTVHVGDVTGDGLADLVAGNLGLNSQIRAGEDTPAELYYADFDLNGTVDPILSLYIQGTSYPYLTLGELRRQIPVVGSRFSSHREFGEVTMAELFSARGLEQARRLEAWHLETTLFAGTEDGGFERRELPVQAQFSPVFTVTPLDYDGDGFTDLVLGGNTDEARIRLGRHDASYGVLLRGGADGSFEYVPQYASGLGIRGAVRSVLRVGDVLLFGVNRGPVRAYALASE